MNGKKDPMMMKRRDFLKAVATGTAAAAMPSTTIGIAKTSSGAGPSSTTANTAASIPTNRKPDRGAAKRVLVVIELQGGNDGLSTLVPLRDPAYRKLRSHTLIEPDLDCGRIISARRATAHERKRYAGTSYT